MNVNDLKFPHEKNVLSIIKLFQFSLISVPENMFAAGKFVFIYVANFASSMCVKYVSTLHTFHGGNIGSNGHFSDKKC